MNINPTQVDSLLNSLPYPIGKNDMVQFARKHGANDQMIGMLDKLPDKTFNNAQELKSSIGSLGNLGNLGSGLHL